MNSYIVALYLHKLRDLQQGFLDLRIPKELAAGRSAEHFDGVGPSIITQLVYLLVTDSQETKGYKKCSILQKCDIFPDRVSYARAWECAFSPPRPGASRCCASSPTHLLLYPGVFLVGLGMGSEVDVIAYLTSRYFGLRAFGEIYGYAFASYTLAGALGPWLMGLGFDHTGSYNSVLLGFMLATVCSAAMMVAFGPYRFRLE